MTGRGMMRRGPAAVAAGLVLSCGINTSGQAQGIPVVDAASVAQQIEQVAHMVEDYTNQLEQLGQLRLQLEAMVGPRGVASLLNTAADQASRVAGDNLGEMQDVLISGGSLAGNLSRTHQVVERLRRGMELDYLAGFSAQELPRDRATAFLGGAGLTSVAAADDGYVRANAGMERVTVLINSIEETPDLKASVDLNTRIMGEQVVMQAELMRMMAAMVNTDGMRATDAARDRMAAREFLINDER